jgi:hypothetical protein
MHSRKNLVIRWMRETEGTLEEELESPRWIWVKLGVAALVVLAELALYHHLSPPAPTPFMRVAMLVRRIS